MGRGGDEVGGEMQGRKGEEKIEVQRENTGWREATAGRGGV
jgi:hypothetical protein